MRDHKSLHAWQEARGVVLGVIDLARTAWKPYAAALFSQLQRASLSVQLNIAEGYAYATSPSFTRHLAIAYGSAVETGRNGVSGYSLVFLSGGNEHNPLTAHRLPLTLSYSV